MCNSSFTHSNEEEGRCNQISPVHCCVTAVFVQLSTDRLSYVVIRGGKVFRGDLNLGEKCTYNYCRWGGCSWIWICVQMFQWLGFISGLQVRKPVASRRRLLAFAVQTVQQGLRVTSGGQIWLCKSRLFWPFRNNLTLVHLMFGTAWCN